MIKNPIHRHYLIVVCMLLVGFAGILGAVEYAKDYLLTVLVVWAFVAFAFLRYSGRCNHCQKPIRQVMFGFSDKSDYKRCYNCGKLYSVKN